MLLSNKPAIHIALEDAKLAFCKIDFMVLWYIPVALQDANTVFFNIAWCKIDA